MVRSKMPRGPTNLPPQFIPVGLAGGIDTKTDFKQVAAPNTLQALNVRYGTGQAVRKRFGTTALGSITNATGVGITNTELLATDATNLYAVDPVAGTLATRGQVGAAALSTLPITAANNTISAAIRTLSVDTMVVGGVSYSLLAYDLAPSQYVNYGMENGGTIYLVLFNAATGNVFWSTSFTGGSLSANGVTLKPLGATNAGATATQTSVLGSAYPTIVAYQGSFYLFFIQIGAGKLTDGSTTITGYTYVLQQYQITSLQNAPIILPTGTTRCTNCQLGFCVTAAPPSGTANYVPQLGSPLYYDVAQNGSDIQVVVTGQNYTAGAAITPTAYNSPACISMGSASTLPMLSTYLQTSIGLPTTNIGAAIGPTLVANPFCYAIMFAGDATTYFVRPASLSPTSAAISSLCVRTPTSGSAQYLLQPLTGFFDTNGPAKPMNLTVTDGANYFTYYIQVGASTAAIVSTNTTSSGNFLRFVQDSTGPNVTPVSGQLLSTYNMLASRAFYYNGVPVAWMFINSDINYQTGTLILVQLIAGTQPVLARAGYQRAAIAPAAAAYFPELTPRQGCQASINASNGQPSIAYSANTNQAETVNAIYYLGVKTSAGGTPRKILTTPQGALILGADPKYYDGTTARTAGWQRPPSDPNPTAYVNTSAPGYTVPGSTPGFAAKTVLTYIFVYTDFDSQGNVIYSAPSSPASVTIPSTPATGVFVVGFQDDAQYPLLPSRGILEVYRNTPSQTSLYTRVLQISNSGGAAPTETWYYDDNSVVGATGNLYAPPSGGELANDPPPPSSLGCSTKQRLFVVGQENPNFVYFSKPFYPGRGVEFNVGQYLYIDPATGPITGIASLDPTIVVFKQDTVFAFSGDGPDATGSGSFTNTTAIATDAGCIDPNSVLTTQAGVWFRSYRGLQLIDRGLQVQYPGLPVESLLVGATVQNAVLVPAQNQVRFSLSTGNVLVYDYTYQIWSVYQYSSLDPTPVTPSPMNAATVFKGTLYGINSTTTLAKESGAGFVDGATNIPMTLQSAWIAVAGPQGWGRIRRVAILGDFRSANTLSLGFSYDYNPAIVYNIPYTASQASQQLPFNWRVRAPRQVCQSIQLTLTDNAPPGEGAVITGLVLEIEPKSQALRVPDAQSV